MNPNDFTDSQKAVKSALEELEIVKKVVNWPGAKTETSIKVNAEYIPNELFRTIQSYEYETVDIHIHCDEDSNHSVDIMEK